jgi:hypothetical protein
MTTKKKAQTATKGKAEVNHSIIAWALAGVLAAAPQSFDAQKIVDAASRLGGASGEPDTFDQRAEVMLRRLLDGHTACTYDLDGQDRGKGKRAYDRLVALAGGPEGSPEPEDRDSCAWLCWTTRRLRAELTETVRESYTEPEYLALGKPRMELGVMFHIVQGVTWREFNTRP